MGQIKDKHRKRKHEKAGDNNPLAGEIGNRDIETNDFDIDEKNIKDQKRKK